MAQFFYIWDLLTNNVAPAVYGAKSLTGFKLCKTTPNNIQQQATGCANGRNM